MRNAMLVEPSNFQCEAQGPLRGGAGALLQGGCRVEEKAGEGEERQGREAQGEVSEQIAKVSAQATDPIALHRLFSQTIAVQTSM